MEAPQDTSAEIELTSGTATPTVPTDEAPEGIAESTPEPESTAESTPAESEKAASAVPDPWKWLEEQDPAEVVKRSARLQGKVGELADRQARQRQIQAEIDAQKQADLERARREREEDERLLDENPYEYRERVRQRKEEADAQQSTWKAFDKEVLNPMFDKLPDEARAALANKPYYGPPAEARLAYLTDILSALSEAKATTTLTAKQAEWEKAQSKRESEIREAERKRTLSEINGSDPSPDISGGTPSSTAMNQAEFDRIKHNVAMLRRPDIAARVSRGLEMGLIFG
jgi:hypothetical protein